MYHCFIHFYLVGLERDESEALQEMPAFENFVHMFTESAQPDLSLAARADVILADLRMDAETIAAALHAAGIRRLGHSPELHRPRGLFCAIGNCSSCFMTVNGQPNVRVCVTRVKNGMRVEEQHGKGVVVT